MFNIFVTYFFSVLLEEIGKGDASFPGFFIFLNIIGDHN